jgi:hypothetical protein
MATVWWWVIPTSESGAQTRPQDAKLISTPDSGNEYNAFALRQSFGNLFPFQGPFQSQSDANAANPSGGSLAQQINAGIGAGLQNDVGVLGTASSAVQSVKNGNPLNALADIGDFFHRLTEKGTWTRVAEFAIGGLLLYVGIKAATRGPAQESVKRGAKRSGSLVGKAAKATPAGKAVAVRKAGKARANKIIYRRQVRERTAQELMRQKRLRGKAP